MLKKFLRDVVIITVGKQAEEIADLINSKKPVNEFIIAKKLDITINQTRNILYRISDHGLVSSIRKKDKRKGWYTYFWKIEILKSLEFLRNILLKNINQIEHQIKSRDTKRFYTCERCNVEFSEENALLHDFTCNECGGIFTMKDNTKLLRELKKNLTRFEEKLKFVDIEIEKEKAVIDKKKLREFKKEEKEKAIKKAEAAKKRAAKRKETAAAKKKVAKKKTPAKKSAKKKVAKKKPIKKITSKKKTVKKKTPAKKAASKKKTVKKKGQSKKIKSAKKSKK